METILIPPFQPPAKPKYGSPCNGCGWCCHEEVCKIGMLAFNIGAEQAPCPAIVYENGLVRCGIVIAEKEAGLELNVYEVLGIGKGCDADDPHNKER